MLQLEHLSKFYTLESGQKLAAVHQIDLSLDSSHHVISLIGPDGSGKSTLLKLIAGLIPPDEGRIVSDQQFTIGYMSQHLGLYEDLSVFENLQLFAKLRSTSHRATWLSRLLDKLHPKTQASDPQNTTATDSFPPNATASAAATSTEPEPPFAITSDYLSNLLDEVGLGKFKDYKAGSLSGGMKQKLALTCAISARPQLLILDEPTVGVDPISRRELWQIIYKYLAESHSYCIFSSLYLEEAEKSEQTIFMQQGQIIYAGSAQQLKDNVASQCFALQVTHHSYQKLARGLMCAKAQSTHSALLDVCPRLGRIDLLTTPNTSLNQLQEELSHLADQANLYLSDCHLTSRLPILEDAYINLTSHKPHQPGLNEDTQTTPTTCLDPLNVTTPDYASMPLNTDFEAPTSPHQSKSAPAPTEQLETVTHHPISGYMQPKQPATQTQPQETALTFLEKSSSNSSHQTALEPASTHNIAKPKAHAEKTEQALQIQIQTNHQQDTTIQPDTTVTAAAQTDVPTLTTKIEPLPQSLDSIEAEDIGGDDNNPRAASYIKEEQAAQATHDSSEASATELTHEVVIDVNKIKKQFGAFTAVHDSSFKVYKGEIFGLLGPNGAGKTTTFRMICALLNPSSGSILINGMSLQHAKSSVRSTIGYVAQKFCLYRKMTLMQNLKYFGTSYGLSGAYLEQRIDFLCETFGLKPYVDELAGNLPFGIQRSLSMACALIHKPAILFLDEATSGADPTSRRTFWSLISQLAATGTTIIVTTHFMEEAEYCDRFLIQDQGKILILGTPDQICQHDSHRISIEEAFISLCQARVSKTQV